MTVVWALVDDLPGHKSQCLGVAEALGLGFEAQRLEYRGRAGLPNVLLGATFGGLTSASRGELGPPWPDLVIAAGRRTAPVARAIKKASGGAAKLVQLMFPGNDGTDEFDLIAAPAHDNLPIRRNLYRTIGAPHWITRARLDDAAGVWREHFQDLPRPRIALLVGGSTRRRTFTEAMARELAGTVSAMAAAQGGSLLVSTSRRSADVADPLIAAIEVPAHVYRWGDEGDNPYFGYLALADAFVVTGDSVSMCSEACYVTRPVYIYGPGELCVPKHARLHQALYDGGYARPLTGTLEKWTPPSLDTAGHLAAEIRKRLEI
jgi:mitochondrial fission protein ELM1